MCNWETFNAPDWTQASYQEPVPVPGVEPGAPPLVCVQFNAHWLLYVLGALFQLTQPAIYDPASGDVELAQQQAQTLMSIVGSAGECTDMLTFRFTDSCGLQYSVDGGTTWIDVPGWDTYAPGCFTGPEGPTGPAGVTPELRWNGCDFQVSYDGGSTWSNLTGFDTSALQACIVGTPGNPQGVSAAQQACNIAGFLAANILQASLGQAASEISSGATLIEAGLSLIELAAALSGVGAVVWAAAGIFFEGATAIGETALSVAASDATLKSNLTCAIYGAILADGRVTSGNFAACATAIGAVSYSVPAVVGLLEDYWNNLGFAGVNAIQGEGSLYVGDCSACSSPPTWCYEWDNGSHTALDVDWAAFGSPPYASYSGGIWHSVIGTDGHSIVLYIYATIPVATTLTDLSFAYSTSPETNSDMLRVYSGAVGSTVLIDRNTNVWSGSQAVSAGATILVAITPSSSPTTLTQFTARGLGGTSPWGPSNC